MRKKIKYLDLTATQVGLLQAANYVMDNAHKIYSGFSVGSALITKDDKIITGCNIENAAYSPSICAERSAISAAVSQGYKSFSMMAVIGKPENGVMEDFISPCGVCRQVIFEFASLSGINTEIIMSNTTMTKIEIWTIDELFPLGFGPKVLGKK